MYFWFYILYGKVCLHVIHVSEKMGGKEKAPISSNQFDLMRWGLLFINILYIDPVWSGAV